MKIIQIFDVNELDGTTTQWVQLERAKDEFTWMPKEVYDQLQTQQGVINAN